MSRVLSLAGFQVTLIGRFWVTTEARPLCCFGAVAQSQWKESRYDQSEPQRTPKLFGSEVRLDEIRYNGMLFALRSGTLLQGTYVVIVQR